MDQSPQKRRWQFSLKVLLIVITMAGVGMGLIRLTLELNEQGLQPEEFIALYALFQLGCILLTASPGVLIGYGYKRLRGAIVGGIVSVELIYFSVIACVLFVAFFF